VVLPRTLSTRIALLAGFLALGGVATLSFILIRAQRSHILTEVVHSSESVAETIRLSINHDMLGNRRDGVREVFESVARHAGIASVRLVNKEGRVTYSSHADEIGRVLDKRSEPCVQCHSTSRPLAELDPKSRSRVSDGTDRGPLLSTIVVIRNEPGCHPSGCHESPAEQSVLGVLDVTMSLDSAETRMLASTRQATLLSLGAVVLITGALFLLVQQTVRRPVNRLIAATRRVATGDYELQVPSGATDEIGFLARSFNEMIESLNTSQQHLEAKVAEKADELRSAQFQVVQAEKLSSVGLVAAGIAHELNSPLMAITTFGHLVQKRLPTGSQEAEDVRMILHEADRCAAIVRTLLDFSRDQPADQEMELCEARAVVDRAMKILQVAMRASGVEAEIVHASDAPLVEANSVQLTQVLVNLLLNAVQAMPGGGRITIRADRVLRSQYAHVKLPPPQRDALLRIRIADTGPGIPRENLSRVFDPFFTTKPVGQGSGLGLSVSHAIVQRHRGAIFVDSDGRSGTEFTVLLPAAEPAPGVVPS
jgi:two-component system NtrC family sensor kinase